MNSSFNSKKKIFFEIRRNQGLLCFLTDEFIHIFLDIFLPFNDIYSKYFRKKFFKKYLNSFLRRFPGYIWPPLIIELCRFVLVFHPKNLSFERFHSQELEALEARYTRRQTKTFNNTRSHIFKLDISPRSSSADKLTFHDRFTSHSILMTNYYKSFY